MKKVDGRNSSTDLLNEYRGELGKLRIPFTEVDLTIGQQEHVHQILSQLKFGSKSFTELRTALDVSQEVLCKKLSTLQKRRYVKKGTNRNGHYTLLPYGSCLEEVLHDMMPIHLALKGKRVTPQKVSAEEGPRQRAWIVLLLKTIHDAILQAVRSQLRHACKPEVVRTVQLEILKFLVAWGKAITQDTILVHVGDRYHKHWVKLVDSLAELVQAGSIEQNAMIQVLDAVDQFFSPYLRFPEL